jgi:hypothetical protein
MTRASLLTAVVWISAAAAMVTAQDGRRPAGDDRVRPLLLGAGNAPAPATSGADAFFDDTSLQEVRLAISEKDWQTLKDNYLLNDYYPCDFKWRNEILRNVGIRSRGTGSRSGIKPGLRVDFDRYTTDQKFHGLKSFVLRNNTQDSTNMHERLTMLFYRRLGAPASREAHTKLYVNDRYSGLFTIVESVDKDFLKRNLGEDAGYLYKYDYPNGEPPYYFEDRGSNPNRYVPLPFKPETHEDDSRPEFVVQWIQAVNQASDALFRSAVGDYLDLKKFVRHVAVEVFVTDYDGFLGNFGVNNFYLYRPDSQKQFTFIPWDKSEAFKSGYAASIWHNIADVPDAQKNHLMSRVLAYQDLYDSYLDTLLDCVRSAQEVQPNGQTWFQSELEREYRQIRDAALADTEKPYSNAEFEAAIDDLRTFALRRADSVTGEVARARR